MFHLSEKSGVLLGRLVPRRLQVGWSRLAAEIAGMGEIEFDTGFDTGFDLVSQPGFDTGFGGVEGAPRHGHADPALARSLPFNS